MYRSRSTKLSQKQLYNYCMIIAMINLDSWTDDNGLALLLMMVVGTIHRLALCCIILDLLLGRIQRHRPRPLRVAALLQGPLPTPCKLLRPTSLSNLQTYGEVSNVGSGLSSPSLINGWRTNLEHTVSMPVRWKDILLSLHSSVFSSFHPCFLLPNFPLFLLCS